MPAESKIALKLDLIFAQCDSTDLPGLAVGVVRDGEPIYVRGFGLANVEHRVPITSSTMFDIASMTKQFTATAVLMLVRDGKLSLQDELRQYMPELPDCEPPIRIRHCLYHTSGLTDWLVALELAGPTSDFCSHARAARTITALKTPMFPAGREHSYSNTGYVLLAWLVARVTGKSLADFLVERLFEPLEMSQATFLTDHAEVLPNLAQGYHRAEDNTLFRGANQSDVCGDGGMLANVVDMIAWLRNLAAQEVGDAGLFDMMFAPGQLDDGTPLRYAAGWEIDRYRGLQVFRHGGIGQGFQSHIAWLPEVSIGVVILANVRPCLPWPAANRVVDALVDPQTSLSVFAALPGVPGQASSDRADDLTGRYFTHTGLPVFVNWRQDRLFIDLWLWCTPFHRRAPDTFVDDDAGDTVVFHRNADGEVTHFTLATQDDASPRMHSPIREAERYEAAVIDAAVLAEFEGRYFSDALETVYSVSADAGGLTAQHLRCHDWQLRPIRSCRTNEFENEFAQHGDWPGMVTFVREPDSGVKGFNVRGARANLFFRRLQSTVGIT